MCLVQSFCYQFTYGINFLLYTIQIVLSFDHNNSQEHDFPSFLQYIHKQVAKRIVREPFSSQSLVMWPNIPVPLLKCTHDINLVIFVYSLLGKYCLNNSEQQHCCHRTSYSKQELKKCWKSWKMMKKLFFRSRAVTLHVSRLTNLNAYHH